MTLPDFRSQIRTLLGSDNIRYPDIALDEALRQTLWQYAAACPQLHQTDLTLTATGRVHKLDSLAGLRQVLEVTNADQARPLPFRLAWVAGVPTLFLGVFTLPAVGDVLRITYTAGHCIAGLDGASQTTLRAAHRDAFIAGAAAQAVRTRSASLLETHGTALNPPDSLWAWAREAEGRFAYWLDQLKRETIGVEEFPAGWNWKLDRWDTATAGRGN